MVVAQFSLSRGDQDRAENHDSDIRFPDFGLDEDRFVMYNKDRNRTKFV